MPTAVAFPSEAVQYLIDVLTGTVPFDKLKAISSAWQVISYLLSLFTSSEALAAAGSRVKVKSFNSEKLVAALENLKGGDEAVKAVALPDWVLAMLLKLLLRWLAGK